MLALFLIPALAASPLAGAWDGVDDVDVVVISHGEQVDLTAHAEPEHFTVYDFGAPWCGPCKVTAATLRAAMLEQDDLAVRAVELVASTPEESFQLPAAQQHLRFVAGLPWLVVVDPDGKRIYKGADAEEALDRIDKRRSR